MVFLIQIASRYVFNAPALWTLEACLTLWLWVVFWGGAFVLQEKDHVRFDVLYVAVGRNLRRGLRHGFRHCHRRRHAGCTTGDMEPTSISTRSSEARVMGIRLDIVFCIYGIFAAMLVIRYFWRAYLVARGADPDELDNREIQDGYPRTMSLALFSCLMVLIVLATIGASIPLSMIVSAIVYLAVKGQDMGLAAEQIIQGLYDSFVILAIPLFIVAANFMNAGTISDRLNVFCLAIVGRLKGGMGHVNVLNSLVFAGMSGSAVADVVGMGKMSIDMMVKDNPLPAGLRGGDHGGQRRCVGPIIPPSIPMVLYSIVSDASIGYLFLGGVVPGLIMCAAMMMLNTYMAHRMDVPLEEPIPLREIPAVTFKAFPALMMPIILLAGIYGGATTPTEAAAIAAAYAFLVAVFFYRALSFRNIRLVMHDSVKSSASVGLIIGSALIFNYIVATENIPAQVQLLMKGVEISPVVFLLLLNFLFLVLGCLLDASTIILVIIPVFIPTVNALGIDLVHFGVVAVVNCMIGLITPPYGVLLFVLNAITGVPMKVLIQHIWPWIGVLVAALLLMILRTRYRARRPEDVRLRAGPLRLRRRKTPSRPRPAARCRCDGRSGRRASTCATPASSAGAARRLPSASDPWRSRLPRRQSTSACAGGC